MVNFLTNIHTRHLITRPLGWIKHLIDILPLFLSSIIDYYNGTQLYDKKNLPPQGRTTALSHLMDPLPDSPESGPTTT